MKHFKLLSPLLLFFVLVSCSISPGPPSANAVGIAAQETAAGAAFLPPVGADVDTAGFFGGAELRYEIYQLEGDIATTHLSPSFATADGSIEIEDDHYHANWKVRDTLRAHPDVTQFRIQVWRDDAVAGTSCLNTPWDGIGPCLLGYFDAQIRVGRKEHDPDMLELNPNQSVPIKVFLTGDGDGGGPAPTSIDELFPLVDPTPGDPKSPFSATGPNCMVNEFSVPSQGFNALGAGFNALGAGFNALGAVGGLFLLEPGTPDPAANPLRIIEPVEAGTYVSGLDGASNPAQNSAILVVDDFGENPASGDPFYTLGDGFFDLTGPIAVATLEDLVANGGFSHGALVMYQLVGTLMGAGFDLVVHAEPGFRIFGRSVDSGIDPDERVYVMVGAVHSRGLDTDNIAMSIDNALAAINYYNTEFELGVERIAINMSFVIIPCSVLEDFQASGIDTFEEYVTAMAAENGVAEAFRDDLMGLLLTPLDQFNDPLYEQVYACELILFVREELRNGSSEILPQIIFPGEGPFSPSFSNIVAFPSEFDISSWDYCFDPAGPSIVYVASAGNFGQDFPLYPAAWELVTGVSSQDAIEGSAFSSTKSSFSNSGEVMAPGALYELSRDRSGGDPAWVIAFAGTSFSAPVTSVYTALDLTQTDPFCGKTDSSLLAHGEPFDVALPAAVPAYCLVPAAN